MRGNQWVCVITQDASHEGGPGEQMVSVISRDEGNTWSKPVLLEPASNLTNAYGVLAYSPELGGRLCAMYNMNLNNITKLPSTGATLPRTDELGFFVMRCSDDGGLSWGSQRFKVSSDFCVVCCVLCVVCCVLCVVCCVMLCVVCCVLCCFLLILVLSLSTHADFLCLSVLSLITHAHRLLFVLCLYCGRDCQLIKRNDTKKKKKKKLKRKTDPLTRRSPHLWPQSTAPTTGTALSRSCGVSIMSKCPQQGLSTTRSLRLAGILKIHPKRSDMNDLLIFLWCLAHTPLLFVFLTFIFFFNYHTLLPCFQLFFLFSKNLLTEPDPSLVTWSMYPSGDHGIPPPHGNPDVLEEGHIMEMESGFYAIGRTTQVR